MNCDRCMKKTPTVTKVYPIIDGIPARAREICPTCFAHWIAGHALAEEGVKISDLLTRDDLAELTEEVGLLQENVRRLFADRALDGQPIAAAPDTAYENTAPEPDGGEFADDPKPPLKKKTKARKKPAVKAKTTKKKATAKK